MKRLLVMLIAVMALTVGCQSMGGDMEDEEKMDKEESMEEEMEKDEEMDSMSSDNGM